MAKKKKRGGVGYTIFLIVYIIAVLTVAFIVLKKVWVLAEEYESSRITYVIDSYVEDLSRNLDESFAGTIAAMEHPMQTDEECIAVAKEMLSSGGITYERYKSSDEGRRVLYRLKCENGVFGEVELYRDPSKLPENLETLDKLEKLGETDFVQGISTLAELFSFTKWFTRDELTPWSVGETKFYFEGLYSSIRVTVPKTYPVTINGHQLGEEYIIEDGIHYDVLEKYYSDYSGLPVKVTYSFDKIIGNMEPVIYDDEGNVAVIDSERDDSQFIKPCSDAETERLTEFVQKFLKYYVGYTSGAYKSEVEYGYGRLRPYIRGGSDIDTRMVAAQDGIYYAHSPATMTSAWMTDAIRLTDGVYICDVGYAASSQTPRGFEEVSVDMKLIIVDNNGDLRVVKEDR